MVIQKPMDLSTLLYNIDEHKYVTVDEFMSDADLIWQNALEYNPDRDPADRHIRHRACALKDTMRVIIRDELDKDFQRICEEIRESRLDRALSHRGRATLELTNGFYNSVFPRNSTGPQQRQRKTEMRTNKAVFEQMQQFNKNRSEESVDEQTPDLVVDHKKLKELLSRAIVKTEAAEVETLEKFYALLAQSIYRHRNNYNKTELIKEMKKEIENFS
ncbi:ATPase family AAA domain-containing protein 2-like isoform X2 [Poecilia latipinna]|nr:PREDICTED: ATPase family AAA domain-containing protein 2-like isoform X2 [Poecilia latipinna]